MNDDVDPRDRIAVTVGQHPDEVTALWNDWRLQATWGDDGEPTSLTFALTSGESFAPSAIRGLPVAGMVDAMQYARVQVAERRARGKSLADRRGTVTLVGAEQVGPRTGRPHDRDTLAKVAQVYASAKEERRPVTRAVAEAFGLSDRGAEKRIAAARKAGML